MTDTYASTYHFTRRKADHEGGKSTYMTDNRRVVSTAQPFEALKAYAESLDDVKPGDVVVGFRTRDCATFAAIVGSLTTRVVFA